MHRQEQPPREGKLRAACDRCHDLKNRCVRIGGADSRCDRCERLNIDCVYRNSSRMGRPRGQRRTTSFRSQQGQQQGGQQPQQSEQLPQKQAHLPRAGSNTQHQAQSPAPSLRRGVRDSGERSPDTSGSGSGTESNQQGADTIISASTTLIESPSDVISLFISPEVVQPSDMDWNLDFSYHINTIHEPFFQDDCHPLPPTEPPRPQPTVVFPDGTSSANGVPNPTHGNQQPTNRLIQLQGELHRLVSAADQEPGMDYVEEGLEATKSLLGVLQATLSEHGCLPTAESGGLLSPSVSSTTAASGQPGDSAWPVHCSISDRKLQHQAVNPEPTGVSFITLQQALTCYSYILRMLDRVVNILASTSAGSHAGSPAPTAAACGVSGLGTDSPSPAAALSLGFFNLASQPALNAEVVLHLVLRMVQHLRVLMQLLASGCKDLVDTLERREGLPPSAPGSDSGSSPGKLNIASIAVTSQAVADLVSEREKCLVERLTCLTSVL